MFTDIIVAAALWCSNIQYIDKAKCQEKIVTCYADMQTFGSGGKILKSDYNLCFKGLVK